MTTIKGIVKQAIERSITHREIVHLRATSGLVEAFLAVCDGDAESVRGHVHEFWGRDRDGDEWRVVVESEVEPYL